VRCTHRTIAAPIAEHGLRSDDLSRERCSFADGGQGSNQYQIPTHPGAVRIAPPTMLYLFAYMVRDAWRQASLFSHPQGIEGFSDQEAVGPLCDRKY
jgi:hypothetical protein